VTGYALRDGQALVISVNDAAWETITFRTGDFARVEAATAAEVAEVVGRAGTVTATVDCDGRLVLATVSRGATASIELDPVRSTAAEALGLADGPLRVEGSGPRAARLVSQAAAPYALPKGAEMSVAIDGQLRRISFKDVTPGGASAEEVASAINERFPGVAGVTRDARVMLQSPTPGAGSSVRVEPGRAGPRTADAAGIIGFSGPAALSEVPGGDPASTRVAQLASGGRRPDLGVENLTGAPIEFLFVTRSAVLPARGSLRISPAEAAHRPLQRLIAEGAVRLTATPR
jgi:hypothetical protein